jgi:DMSO/TMAO reductase YedYZ molybdopterin-dependent catalytic subunit
MPMTDRKAPRTPHGLFAIEGNCQRPMAFGPLDLAEVHRNYQVDDVATVDERLSGKGVRLRKLIDLVGPGYGTAWLTIENLEGLRHCVPLGPVVRTAIVIYEKGGKPLPREEGGPVRLVVPHATGPESDVRHLSRLSISRDPTTPAPAKAPGREPAARR